MANGEYKRGEIYAISFGDAVGSEQAAYRPGLIISSDVGNRTSPNVIVAYTTTKNHNIGTQHETMATRIRTYIQCEQIATVSKQRLGRLMGMLSENEMHDVEDILDIVLDLGTGENSALKEAEAELEKKEAAIEELRSEKQEVESELQKMKDSLADADDVKNIEIEMWKRLYDKAMGQVVDLKYNFDMLMRERKAPVEVKPPVVVAEEQPVESVEPVPEGKVNINTASSKELHEKLGMPMCDAYSICGYRRQKRSFTAIEELLDVPRFTKYKFDKYKDRLAVGGVEAPKTDIVNINTVATASELKRLTGMSMSTAAEIVRHRREHGPYKSLEELLQLEKFGEISMDRYGKMLTV